MFELVDHPVIHDKMTRLRRKSTGTKEFRELVAEISTLLCYEALRAAHSKRMVVETPVDTHNGIILSQKYAIVPIYRAGLGMMDGVLHVLPNAKIGHIGAFRDPDTLEPTVYYKKFPSDISEREVLLLDPMLATGGTADVSIKLLKEHNPKGIKFLCLVSCPTGVERIRSKHPDVPVYTAAYDLVLTDHGYISPGLGDAGDRIFGTK
jgi:uracil phosphoribosyltransferase